jgi:hypothetical protein
MDGTKRNIKGLKRNLIKGLRPGARRREYSVEGRNAVAGGGCMERIQRLGDVWLCG